MRNLVTGGAGFIGSHVVASLLEKGEKVYLIDNLSTGSKKNIQNFLHHPNLECHYQDLNNVHTLGEIIQNVDVVYHFAAVVGVYRVLQHPEEVLSSNINATIFLLETIKKYNPKCRVILASSSEVYGKTSKDLLAEEDDLVLKVQEKHRVIYSISKVIDEVYGLTFHEIYGLNVTILRIFNTIGPRQSSQYGMVIPQFIQQALHQQPIQVFGDGNQKRSFCDVRDLVSLIQKVKNEPKTIGMILNIGHDEEISILELAHMIIDLTKSNSSIEFVTYESAYHEIFEDFQFRRPDLTRLKSLISVNFQWNLPKTLKNLIEIYSS